MSQADELDDSGGYSPQGDEGPSDTYSYDELAIRRTERLNPPDLDPNSPEDDFAEGSVADEEGDHGEDESTGGGEYMRRVPSRAPSGPSESWNFRDKHPATIPAHLYDPPGRMAGAEEGDDTMDASGYLSALNDPEGARLGDLNSFLRTLGTDVGKSAATSALVSVNKALGGAGTKQVEVSTAPPMSLGAKILIAVAVGIPAVYFISRAMRKGSSPAVATNPRRRRRRRR